MRLLGELGPAEVGNCLLKVMQSGTDILICDGPYQMKFSRGQAHGLMAVLHEHFNGKPIPEKDAEPAEDTVALLCAAARKWAKWDARWQELMQHETCDSVVYDRINMKREKWRNRTLSYGHHLLSAGVPEDSVWSSADITKMMARGNPFASVCIDPAAEMKRLDTLVQQLCARVAVLEGNEPA